MSTQPTFEGQPNHFILAPELEALTSELEVLGCQAALFEWAESYDTKDWDRLSKCIAPILRVSLSALRLSSPIHMIRV